MEWLVKDSVQASWLTAHKLSVLSINYESPYVSLSHLNKGAISFHLEAETFNTLTFYLNNRNLPFTLVSENHLPQQSLAWFANPWFTQSSSP